MSDDFPPRPPEGGPPSEGEEYMDVSRIHAVIMREKDEPTEGYEPIPTTWLTVVILLAMWGGFYLGTFNMAFDAQILDGSPSSAGVQAQAQAQAEPENPMALGRRVYNNCMGCHQATGSGVAGQFPPLAQSEWVLGDAASLVRILLQGLGGPIEVLDRVYDGAMPAWAGKLSDAQIGAVLTYIRQSWGNTAGAVEVTQVSQLREREGGRKSPWSASELRAASAEP